MAPNTNVLLVQLGSPSSPRICDVRAYLRAFLGDPRVVDKPHPLIWKLILNLFILPTRPYQSARAYERIWDGKQFPLVTITEAFAYQVQQHLPPSIKIHSSFLLSHPTLNEIWEKNRHSPHPWLIVPLFPQYSESTTASIFDQFCKIFEKEVFIPPFSFINNFHLSKAFIDNSVQQIEESLKGKNIDALVMSFHGIPKRRVIVKKDPYYRHCLETFFLIKKNLKALPPQNIHISFQSRFGGEEWLTPYTDAYCSKLISHGHKKLAIYCPSFVSDCLETIDEIGTELKNELSKEGGEVVLIPCLNRRESWCQDFAKWIQQAVESPGREEMHYRLSPEENSSIPKQTMQVPPLTPKARQAQKIIFITLFLDLVGFSIIFPLFPSLARHYLEVDGDNFFLTLIFDSISTLMPTATGDKFSAIVLFGGVLGALYSLLQFIAAPLWGTISDRIGRRPVLLLSVSALALSYGMWFFAGSFTILILSRFIGGIMGGNISTATAVIADVTDSKNRSRGMAVIGIAFALGFILGPAIGGLSSLLNLNALFPSSAEWGINPFSMPAAFAFTLSCVNLYLLKNQFQETLPPEKRNQSSSERTFNPLALFRPLPYKGVNLTNFGHFLFLSSFAGMEFTLTFLAVERLGYTPLDNAWMFIFVGIVIALIQGGYVRRKAPLVGEKKMALMGLSIIVPGMVLIALTHSSWLLYAGLFFLSVGSAMAIPTLTSLVSLYTPPEHQGRSLGIFRSLGALARVIGPVTASLIYWKYGSAFPYLWGSLFLILPITLIALLPPCLSRESVR